MSERFKVVEGSQAGYSCFAATVVDTARDSMGNPYTPDAWRFYAVCECHERNDALTMCNALNATIEETA